MRDYGVVHSTYWTSATSHDFSDDAKLLGVYLLTGPHSSALGCFRIPDGYVTDDLKWDIKRVREGFKELLAKGWANRCETTKWVFIYNYLKFNPPENPNQRKSLRRLASQVPDNATFLSDLAAALLLHCGPLSQAEMFDEKGKGSETLSQPFCNQDQDQDHIQNQIKSVSSEPSGSKPSSPANGSVKVLINLPMLGKKEFPIDEHQVTEWERLYPAVDVMQELRKMRGWLQANPDKRKIKVLRFANTWLAKEQDRGGIGVNRLASVNAKSSHSQKPWEETLGSERGKLIDLWARDLEKTHGRLTPEQREQRVRNLMADYPFVAESEWPVWMRQCLSKKVGAGSK